MNKGIYYITQQVLSTQRQNEQYPDSNQILSLAQLIFTKELTSNSSSTMRMCCFTSY
ncbi:MAG: hypothetical protein ACOYMD_10690 [Paludibacter sp.]